MISALAVLVMMAALLAATIVDDVEIPGRSGEWSSPDADLGTRGTVTVLSTASRTGGATSGCWSGGLTEGGQPWV